ncbi:hypothetical protein [Thalassospira mesophila]|uniref:Uncharacterized protein n=1 Tax=Thalassospira mesophila TaxID=1293891 RepID=A0A1Y2KWH1_9PROT|nr:hypothetical protein [Thalassospira mesophila]OSQ36001.1 hypothetical protein TMES_19445 [Thalassospira mesophila]
MRAGIVQLSLSIFFDEDANPYYKINPVFETEFVGRDGMLPVLPGITVLAGFVAGKRMKPVSGFACWG